MTRELLYAFTQLRISERDSVLRSMGIKVPKHMGETGLDFCTRAVRLVCAEGRVRELEEEMQRYQ
ncbi:hypothetical protein D3C80_774560 [compost metagenome]